MMEHHCINMVSDSIIMISDYRYVQPSLTGASMKRVTNWADLKQNILKSLRSAAVQLKEKPDADSDKLGRLDAISSIMATIDLGELHDLWQSVKSENDLIA